MDTNLVIMLILIIMFGIGQSICFYVIRNLHERIVDLETERSLKKMLEDVDASSLTCAPMDASKITVKKQK